MRDPEAFAEMVVLMVKETIAPLKERLAAAEARAVQAAALEGQLLELRERVVIAETKAASIQIPDTSDVRDRLMALEHKSSGDPLSDIKSRLSALESKPAPDIKDSTVLAEMRERISGIEASASALKERCDSMVDAVKESVALREKAIERLAVVEARAPVPGPQGPAGRDGKDGVDGVGFDDLTVVQHDERTFVVKAAKGEHVKDIGKIEVPYAIYRGVFQEGRLYTKGDLVTWAGSLWVVNEETTSRPEDLSRAWTLCVKKGRDGRDGKDGKDAGLPVVSIGRAT